MINWLINDWNWMWWIPGLRRIHGPWYKIISNLILLDWKSLTVIPSCRIFSTKDSNCFSNSSTLFFKLFYTVRQYISLNTLPFLLTPNYLTFFISNISINSNMLFGRLTTRVSHRFIESFKTKGQTICRNTTLFHFETKERNAKIWVIFGSP